MVNTTNANDSHTHDIMKTHDDRPLSMYDNLNNMNANMNAVIMPANKSILKIASAPTTVKTNATAKSPSTATATENVTVTPPTSRITNGAAHSTPFTNIIFKFNEKDNKPQQKEQQFHINGNGNLSEIPPNTGNAAVYSTPYKTSVASTASAPPIPQQQQHSPLRATTTATQTNTLTSSPSLLLLTTATVETPTPTPTPIPIPTPTPTSIATAAAINLDTFNSFNRPLSQHSQSELNDTSHNIAAVKAALNEAKSKFFGLNGHSPNQTQQLQDEHNNYDDNYHDESLNIELLRTDIQHHPEQIPNNYQAQQQQVQKPQPKYQNIPQNSAIFRNQNSDGADSPPELPPKPLGYQNLQQSPTRSIQTSAPDQGRKMSVDATTYNQISLNDIDRPASRSQTVYMATTVPQNIKGNKIAGRHTPTRSSLRHSRMLVVNNKNYEDVQYPNPMGFQQPNLARWLLILQIIIAGLILSLSIWIFFLTPNTPLQDNPYWCGLVLLIAGIVGLVVIRYHRCKRAKTREHCFMFLRMDSYVLSLLSVLLCCVALIFAAIHFCRLTSSDTKCKSMHILEEHGSCVCTFNSPPIVNTTELLLSEFLPYEDEANQIADQSYNVEYRDLSCQEVTGSWTSILGLSFILNSLGFAISLTYIVLLACCRRPTKHFYKTVRTSTF